MRVLRLPSTTGTMPAHSRLTSASAAGSRARKLDSHTIVAPRGGFDREAALIVGDEEAAVDGVAVGAGRGGVVEDRLVLGVAVDA
jgi:hypothetical protein